MISKRTRFTRTTECITLYPKPCGCAGSWNYLPKGCISYEYGPGLSTDYDLIECRECGAVWTQGDVQGKWCKDIGSRHIVAREVDPRSNDALTVTKLVLSDTARDALTVQADASPPGKTGEVDRG